MASADGVAVAGGERLVLGGGRGDHLDAVGDGDELHQALGDLRRVLDHERVHHLLVRVADLELGRTRAPVCGPPSRGVGACIWGEPVDVWQVQAMSWFFTA